MKKLSRDEMKNVMGGSAPVGCLKTPNECNTDADCSGTMNKCKTITCDDGDFKACRRGD